VWRRVCLCVPLRAKTEKTLNRTCNLLWRYVACLVLKPECVKGDWDQKSRPTLWHFYPCKHYGRDGMGELSEWSERDQPTTQPPIYFTFAAAPMRRQRLTADETAVKQKASQLLSGGLKGEIFANLRVNQKSSFLNKMAANECLLC